MAQFLLNVPGLEQEVGTASSTLTVTATLVAENLNDWTVSTSITRVPEGDQLDTGTMTHTGAGVFQRAVALGTLPDTLPASDNRKVVVTATNNNNGDEGIRSNTFRAWQTSESSSSSSSSSSE